MSRKICNTLFRCTTACSTLISSLLELFNIGVSRSYVISDHMLGPADLLWNADHSRNTTKVVKDFGALSGSTLVMSHNVMVCTPCQWG